MLIHLFWGFSECRICRLCVQMIHNVFAVSNFTDLHVFGFRILGFLGLFDFSDFFGLTNDIRTIVCGLFDARAPYDCPMMRLGLSSCVPLRVSYAFRVSSYGSRMGAL